MYGYRGGHFKFKSPVSLNPQILKQAFWKLAAVFTWVQSTDENYQKVVWDWHFGLNRVTSQVDLHDVEQNIVLQQEVDILYEACSTIQHKFSPDFSAVLKLLPITLDSAQHGAMKLYSGHQLYLWAKMVFIGPSCSKFTFSYADHSQGRCCLCQHKRVLCPSLIMVRKMESQ